MEVYKYNDQGYFESKVPCQKDPIASKREGRDIWLQPADTTPLEPLEEKEGFKVKFNKDANRWEYEAIPEPEPEPEPTEAEKLQQKVWELKGELSSSDYKIIKCTEAQLAGEESPYDIAKLHEERQALRDEINSYENELKDL